MAMTSASGRNGPDGIIGRRRENGENKKGKVKREKGKTTGEMKLVMKLSLYQTLLVKAGRVSFITNMKFVEVNKEYGLSPHPFRALGANRHLTAVPLSLTK